MSLGYIHLFGFFTALILIVAASAASSLGTRNKSGSAWPLITGAMMGTFIGGSSTVGTAQLAYVCGMSAWWFTLGGAIACVFLALAYARPLRSNGLPTLTGMIGHEYGVVAGYSSTVLSSIGTFINIISQLIAGSAVIEIVFPSIPLWQSLLAVCSLMILYVVFGGVRSAALAGLVKLSLLCLSVIAGFCIITTSSGGLAELCAKLDPDISWNLFSRGIGKDLGAGLSLLIGVLSTQTYAQFVLAGRTDRDAIRGTLVSAFLIPPIGMGGVLIGLFMRVHHPDLVNAKLAFPQFILTYMPDYLAGLLLATLLVAVIGAGAGLALGISTMLSRDIIGKLFRSISGNDIRIMRTLIILILGTAAVLAAGPLGDMILNFAFMSMGLRGAVVFIPLTCALFLSGRVNQRMAIAAIFAGPLTVLIAATFIHPPFDPLFAGIGTSALLCLLGLRKNIRT